MAGKPKRRRGQYRSGGASALGGFLYQILTAAGLRASSVCSDGVTHGNYALLLSLSSKGGVVHEAFGEDIALALKDGEVALIQCKFSQEPNAHPIKDKELSEIADHMARSWTDTEHEGKAVREMFLVTNRHLSSSAAHLLAKAKRNISNKQRSVKPSVRAVLQRLKPVPVIPPDFWINRLDRCAANYGVLPDEREKRTARLVGQVLTQTAQNGSCELSLDHMISCLTDSNSACEITLAALHPHMQEEIQRFDLTKAGQVLVRDRLTSDMNSLSRRALVVFIGKGGSGKTIALYEWADQLRKNQAVVLTLRRRDVTANTIPDVVAKWRRITNPVNSPEDALQRLEAANPTLGHPVLHVSLDGLDEDIYSGGNWREVEDFIRWFYKLDQITQASGNPPPARLVISCRNIKLVEDFCVHDTSGYGATLPFEVARVEFDDFSMGELADLFSRNAPSLVDRVVTSLRENGQPQFSDSVPSITGPDPCLIPASSEVLEALRDPSMWGAFVNLNAHDQDKALSSDSASLQRLVEVWVKRFCSKAARRHTSITSASAKTGLQKAVALPADSIHLKADWITAIFRHGTLTEGLAAELYDEALSGGLIVEDSPSRWYWRHPFAVEYIRQPDHA